MFIRTLGYTTERVVDVALKSNIIDFVSTDKGGKHTPKHKMKTGDVAFLENHIRSFNPAISHYRR